MNNNFFSFLSDHDGAVRQMLLRNTKAESQGQPIFVKGVTPSCSLLCLSASYVAVVGLKKNEKGVLFISSCCLSLCFFFSVQ
jgi:hypothetical protein